MKTRSMIVIILFLSIIVSAYGADSDIRLNSIGFLPDMPKKATIIVDKSSSSLILTQIGLRFTIKDASGNSTVFAGAATGPVHQQDVNEDAWTADFSKFNEKGKFYLEAPGVGRSVDFEIGDTVYNFPFYTVMRGFYLWRCGVAVDGTHNGIKYSHAPCHMQDGYQDYTGFGSTIRDATGGWHDAGDYGKYTVNAGITAACMFMAWDHFQDKLKDVSLDIPDTAPGYPDFLKELKWETDWLLKMQYPDGSGKVSHKLTRVNFSGFVMPDTDTEKRFFTDWGTAATADFVATMAMAARYFKPYDAPYAQKCLDAATKSYNFLKENPEYKRFEQGDFKTGGYQTQDPDDRLWAAAEIWETTGSDKYLKDFEDRALTGAGGRARRAGERLPISKIDEDWDWGNVRNLGMFTYILSKREGKNPELVEAVRKDLITTADNLVARAKQDIYGRPMLQYYWGCNGTVARQVLNLQVANMVAPNPEYVNAAADAIAHIFGRNHYNRSYVTGLGIQPPMNPHDRRSGADGITEPWPGYLVGGGLNATNWNDIQDDYRTNEIAVNWQAALVYAMAGFTNPQ